MDPIEEDGGNNLYSFVSNAAINGSDLLGKAIQIHPDTFEVVVDKNGKAIVRWGKLVYKYIGSRNPDRHKEFADQILRSLQAVIGDCAKLETEIVGRRRVRVTEGVSDLGWKKYKPGEVASVPIYGIIYRNEKKDCKCDPCWQQLKEALNMRRVLTVYWSDVLDNASGGPKTYVNPNIYAELPEVDGQSRAVPFSIVLWHELIGHGFFNVYHSKKDPGNSEPGDGTYYDPIIRFENMGRACLRAQGVKIKDRRHYYFN